MKLKGIRTNHRTGKETEVELTYEIREGKYGPVFQLHGGPTGYESFYIEEGTLEAMAERGWCACMGGGGWDKLEISAEEMKKVYDAQVVAKGGDT